MAHWPQDDLSGQHVSWPYLGAGAGCCHMVSIGSMLVPGGLRAATSVCAPPVLTEAVTPAME